MDDLELIQKKTGMTIGTAWILMFSSVVFLFLIGFSFGVYMAASGQKDAMNQAVDFIMISLVASFSIFAIIGFWINKKEWFYTQKPSLDVILLVLLIAILWSFVSSFFMDYFPKYDDRVQIGKLTNNWLFGILLNSSMIIFQIGVIGHGLLRNYELRRAMGTICFICITFYMPAAVVSLVLQSMILLYLYYRTASFWLVYGASLLMFSPQYFLRYILGESAVNINFWRVNIIQNDMVYYGLLAIAVLLIGVLIWQIKNKTVLIKWAKEYEYPF
jgi:hypothetical protein